MLTIQLEVIKLLFQIIFQLLVLKKICFSNFFTISYKMLFLKELRLLFLYEFKLGYDATISALNINLAFRKTITNERNIQW